MDDPPPKKPKRCCGGSSPSFVRPHERFPWRTRHPAVRQQSQMDCGSACLATLCRYYGKRVSLNRLRDLARVGTAGASLLHIMLAARQLGFEAQPILSTLDHLQQQSPARDRQLEGLSLDRRLRRERQAGASSPIPVAG